MGLIKNFIQDGIGLAGKALMHGADVYTGGLASKLVDKGLDAAKKNSGLIGKVAGGIGRSVLSDSVRKKMSNAATKAIDYLPSGKVKDTLKSLNDAAQDKSSTSIVPKSTGKRRKKRKFRDV